MQYSLPEFVFSGTVVLLCFQTVEWGRQGRRETDYVFRPLNGVDRDEEKQTDTHAGKQYTKEEIETD